MKFSTKKRKRIFIVLLIVFCLSLILVTAFLTDGTPTFLGRAASFITTPIQSALTSVGNWVSDFFETFRSMAELQEEIRRLQAENALLVVENSQLRYTASQVEHYAMLLYTQQRYADYPTLVAQVRAVDPGNWYNSFIIDRGSNDGLMVNMPVLANGALVGRVSRVWPNSARVESIIDDRSGVSAKVFRSNAVGIVRGDVELMMEGLVLMEFTVLGVDIAEGDEIQTSQLSSFFPPGLVIGHVESVEVDARGMTSAVVRPVADFSLVNFVLVVTELFDLDYGD